MNTTPQKATSDVTTILTSGSCHCGEVEYTIDGPMLKQSYCDCAACRKATGALRVPFVTVPQDSLAVKGTLATVRGHTDGGCDQHGSWRFCPTCGTNLFWMPDEGDQVDVLAGALDDVSLFRVEE
jgi:hypothetical protein